MSCIHRNAVIANNTADDPTSAGIVVQDNAYLQMGRYECLFLFFLFSVPAIISHVHLYFIPYIYAHT